MSSTLARWPCAIWPCRHIQVSVICSATTSSRRIRGRAAVAIAGGRAGDSKHSLETWGLRPIGEACVPWVELPTWNGSHADAVDLTLAIMHNCDCQVLKRRCDAHKAMLDQRFLNGILWARW